MKKIILVLIVLCCASGVIAQKSDSLSQSQPQTQRKSHGDSLLSRWCIDINGMAGMVTKQLTTADYSGTYLNAIGTNTNISKMTFNNGMGFGFDAQLGYFFGRKRHFGIGLGVLYQSQQGDVTMDKFHVEYQSIDGNGYTFRQLITANNSIKETIKSSNFNIPLLLKYKDRFSKHWGFTADAGIVFNLQESNSYSTSNASFDYEGIYQLNGGKFVYDNSSTPAGTDLLITKQAYLNTHGNNSAGLQQFFTSEQQNLKMNVGLGVKPSSNSGSVSYQSGSIGFLVRPALNYFFSDVVALNLGVYFLMQNFANTPPANYALTDKMGSYNSMLTSVKTDMTTSMGLNIGVRIFLGRTKPIHISLEPFSPSACGMYDGYIKVHGLPPGKTAVVNYLVNNNTTPSTVSSVVATDSMVNLPSLASGSYTVTAMVGKKTATAPPVTLTDPKLTIKSVTSTNPSAQGVCDASITLEILNSAKDITISYSQNGRQGTGNAIVGSDHKVSLNGLCEGDYSSIMVTSNKCTAKVTTPEKMSLIAPVPPPPPPPAHDTEKKVEIDIETPILFDVNKTTIKPESLPVLEAAAKVLIESFNKYIVVDGYTDKSGSAAYNMELSKKRANAVKKYLMSRGVSEKQLKAVGHGKKEQIEPSDTPEGKARNRRVIMHMKSKEESDMIKKN